MIKHQPNVTEDIKYDKGEFTVNELKTIVQELNQEQDSEMIIKQNQQELFSQSQLVLSIAKKKPHNDHNQTESESCDMMIVSKNLAPQLHLVDQTSI
ncbi:13572_t:CDS:2 [Dentiscutata heterogama]|uniref:13572_t:CDS:1 n=1 Tax=Dentiscutata heterogama TaxID=1316150 RepID=A0ACA9LQK0_9GLOM|nr:13572_t:CDS:2 [Dentiscutata heterogama]